MENAEALRNRLGKAKRRLRCSAIIAPKEITLGRPMKLKTLTYVLLMLFTAAISVLPSDTINVALSIHEGTNMAAALSPDGKTLVIDLLGVLWTVPATGGIAHRITDDFADARQPAWSPAGKASAFQS